MTAIAFYLLKMMICSAILFTYYWLALRNKLFHRYNRFYLLAAVVLSLILPLIEIHIRHSGAEPAPQALQLLQAVNGYGNFDDTNGAETGTVLAMAESLKLMYLAISGILLLMFVGTLLRIRYLFKHHQHSVVENVFFVNTTAKGTPFSFLRYIFWNDHIDPESPTGNQVFRHELAHVQQKHSYDKLFINGVLVVFWCNPLFWLIRKEISMIHEFVADKIAVEDSDTGSFAAMILQAAYPRHRFPLVNHFFYSPIKRRLMMLTKNRNHKVGYLHRLLALPLIALIFAGFTLRTKTIKPSGHYEGKKVTVVVDAGHGGSDLGATSMQGNTSEKELNLALSKIVKSLNANPDIQIMLTRESDVYQTLQQRVAFTKASHADLFISIHLSGKHAVNDATDSGLDVWIANNHTNEKANQLLASALISEFNNNYSLPVRKSPQKSNVNIRVLQDAACPAALLEAGNISNAKDLAFLETAAGKQAVGARILAAIERYLQSKDKEVANVEPLPAPDTSPKAVNLGGASPLTIIDDTPASSDTVPVTLNGAKPLVIIDGKESDDKKLQQIPPTTVQSVNVLKGKEATAPYGVKGKNGVVIVTTKTKPVEVKKEQINIQTAEPVKVTTEQSISVKPIIVLDGKIQSMDFDVNLVQPVTIETVSVLKGEQAQAKYGKTAVNGVVEIKTKNAVIVKDVNVKIAPEVKTDTQVTVPPGEQKQDKVQ